MFKKTPSTFLHLIWLMFVVIGAPVRAEILREAKAVVQRYNDQIDRDEPSTVEPRAPSVPSPNCSTGPLRPPTLPLCYVVESNFSPKTIKGLATPIVEIFLAILRREKSSDAEWTLNWAFRDAPLSKIFWRHAMPTLDREHIVTRTHGFAAGAHQSAFAQTREHFDGGTLFHDERPDQEDLRPVHGDVADGHAHNEGKVV